jgi:hypothetical protein
MAINNFPVDIDPFEHIGSFYGFSTIGLRDRLEQRHVDVLLPYLRRLNDSALHDLAEFCERHGKREWGFMHLKPEFDQRRAQLSKVAVDKRKVIDRQGRYYFPSDADLLQELDGIEQRNQSHGLIYHWCERFDQRQDPHAHWRQILDQWLSQKPNLGRFHVVADAILDHGTRSDLELLDKEIEGDATEIGRLRLNGIFGVKRRTLQTESEPIEGG